MAERPVKSRTAAQPPRIASQGQLRRSDQHLVPEEILRQFLPGLSAIQAQYDQETRRGQSQPNLGVGVLGTGSGASAMPSASGPPTALQPMAGNVPVALTPATAQVEAGALRNICTEQERMIAALQEQLRQSRADQGRQLAAPPCGQWAPLQKLNDRPLERPPASSGPACLPEGPLPKSAPDVAVPKMRSKAPKAPAPQTGCAARRTVILPPLSRLNRAQLENLAVQWEVDPRGKTVAQIRDALYELDKDMREGRRPVPAKST